MFRMPFSFAIFVLGFGAALAEEKPPHMDFSYRPSIAVTPGKTLTIKGVRGKSCGDPAPAWEDIVANLPVSTTGAFSDGGIGTVRSRACGKAVPARGVMFTATTKGREKFTVFRDHVAITVF